MMGVKINRSEKERPDRFEPNGDAGSTGVAPPLRPGARDHTSDSEIDQRARLKLFEEVILPHLSAAYNLARWLTRNEQDAQDVVQESYLRAFRFFDGYRGGDGKSWLFAVVRNTCFAWRRHERRSINEPFDEMTHSSRNQSQNQEEMMVQSSNMSALRNCIEMLPLGFREVLVMRELEEMSYKEISDVACLPVGTVMSRLSRARRRLVECASREKMRDGQ